MGRVQGEDTERYRADGIIGRWRYRQERWRDKDTDRDEAGEMNLLFEDCVYLFAFTLEGSRSVYTNSTVLTRRT